MLYIPQIQSSDCGFACLKILLAHINKDQNYLYLRQDREKGCYSYQQLVDIAEKEGLSLRGVKVEDKQSILKHKDFPFIVSLNTPSGGKHSVVVKKIIFKRVYIIDPVLGHTSLNLKKFIDLWDGTALLISSFTKTKCKDKPFEPIAKPKKLLFYLGHLIVGVLAIFGVYFIKENTYIFIPIVLFLLAIIMEIVMKAYSFSVLKKIDQVFLNGCNVKKKNFHPTFVDFQNFKKNFFHSSLTLIINLLVALGIILVTLVNDYRNFLLLLAPLLVSIIDYLVLNPYLQKENKKVEILENQISSINTKDDYIEKINQIHDKAYRIGKIFIFKRFAYLAAFIATSIILIAVTRIVSFPYAVFYCCIEFAFYEVLSKIISYQEKENQFLKDKIKISNIIHLNDDNNSVSND